MQVVPALARAMACLLGGAICAQSTELESKTPGGQSGNSASAEASISANGRYVSFFSFATDLVSGDTNGHIDVFVRDRWTGVTERVSVSSSGVQGNGDSDSNSISADGRFVAFASAATNFVARDMTGPIKDIYLRDRQTATTELVSLSSADVQAYGDHPSVSADGDFVEFTSEATLTPDAPSGFPNIYLRDRRAGTTECISRVVGPPGPFQSNEGAHGFVSDDGRYVVFQTYVDNIVPGDTNQLPDVFVRDRWTGSVEWITRSHSGQSGGFLGSSRPISADGRFVVFASLVTSFVRGDSNGKCDVFVRDRFTDATELMSVDSRGVQGDGDSAIPAISANGRYVVFMTLAYNLLPPDHNAGPDILVRDRLTNRTERTCVNTAGSQANYPCYNPGISSDGRFVVFETGSTNLDYPADHDPFNDVYLRDRFGDTAFESLCDPGTAGVLSCPCANPPARLGRGCDNSSGTGGAALAAVGAARLSADSLVLSTRDEPSSAASFVIEGSSDVANGTAYGQGVRCVGGRIVRLYSRNAVGGSISVPEVVAGDAPISARSAAAGDPIQPGDSRWYLVLYRDPVVLGGCSSTSTFNSTQTGRIDWSL